MVKSDSLEIFKQNKYFQTDLGLVSDNAYLSIVATNNCQCKCAYCINSETDHSLSLPVNKAIKNIKKLVDTYGVKEAIILGGEPTLHPDLFYLLKKLRTESGLEMIRLTTNGIKLKNNHEFIEKLVDKDNGIQGINISFHNEEFMTLRELGNLCFYIKLCNPNIKIRINSNIWKNNLDTFENLIGHIKCFDFVDDIRNTKCLNFVDEIRISNIIKKDSFSVNPKNIEHDLVLPDEEYIKLFEGLIDLYSKDYTIFENTETLGFVRYLLIPTKVPIIINWNLGSTVADQVCENDIKNRKINTFKCLVNGEISLSWNNHNILKL